MSDKDNNLLKSDILTVGSELSEKLNAIGVPNTFGKASEGKDNLMSIIRMTINGLDMTIDQIREILRDYYNKSEVNTLLNGKSDTSHNHDTAYARKNHNHNSVYAHILHQHDGADVILSNSNDVDTEIGNIENDITSLSTSITNLVQIQSVSFDFGSLTVNSTSTKTKTVKAKPDGMDSAVIPRTQNYCTIQGANLNGTSFSLTAQNQSNGTHTCNATVLLVYYPHSWSI